MKQQQIHELGKIDIHGVAKTLEKTLLSLESDEQVRPENRALIKEFIRDCRLGKTVLHRRKRVIGPATCLKYIFALKSADRYLKKSFVTVEQQDMEAFIEKLSCNEIVSRTGSVYSDWTKVGIKKAIKKFWKWKDGNNKVYPEIVEWIDTYVKDTEIPALKREETQEILDCCANARDKALIMVLFDSGARIEELLNVRLHEAHVMWKKDLKCYKIRLEFSKTKPRTISVPLSTKELKKWLEVHPGKADGRSQLFPMSYGAVRMLVKRLGQRALSKRVTPHIFRHSSATYYANRLNRYQLCHRYGWAMSSSMVDRYLDRAGIIEDRTPDLIRVDEIQASEARARTANEESTLLKERNLLLEKEVQQLKNDGVRGNSGSGILSTLHALTVNQRQMSKILEELSGKRFDMVIPLPT
ncbi:site-specific integrase [bacterium AH-315-J21]|nr:site-specific integrase [bacterium AH-315-J21]